MLPEIFAIKVGSCIQSTKKLSRVFRGGASEFLDLHYKNDIKLDHVAKFRPRELGDRTAN